MPYHASKVEDGKDKVAFAFQRDHWTLWGCGVCIHLYSDADTLSEDDIWGIAVTLEALKSNWRKIP